MNKVVVIGRLTKDATLAYAQGTGKAVARFTVAVDRLKKGEADFISCVAFDKLAESISTYCGTKGSLIGIAGHLQTGSYKDKKEVTHYTCDVICDEAQFLNPKGSNNAAPSNEEYMELDDDNTSPF
jgi:single-strand DNA-binding protein